jgi:DNA-directed RNA polymerase specialized sigma24 family protein
MTFHSKTQDRSSTLEKIQCAWAERSQLWRDVERVLVQLPVEQREAFVMHYVDGMRTTRWRSCSIRR